EGELKDWKSAYADENEAVRLCPRSLQARKEREMFAMIEGQYAVAVSDLRMIADAEPNAPNLVFLAEATIKTGDYQSAIAECDRAIAMRPDYPFAREMRGNARFGAADYAG